MQKPKIGNFSFSILQWNFDPIDRNYDFFGSYYRGILGTALKKRFCILRNSKCGICPLRDGCLYMLTFERYRDALFPPYVMNRTERDSLRMVMIGSFAEFSDVYLDTLSRRLRSKEAGFIVPGFEKLLEGRFVVRISELDVFKSIPYRKMMVEIKFMRIKKDSSLVECSKLMFDDILRAIERRIYLVNKFYGDSNSSVYIPKFNGSWRLVDCRYFVVKRYSNRKKCLMTIPSTNCKFEITGDIEVVYPYLFVAKFLNIGTNASMGFGQLDLYPIS